MLCKMKIFGIYSVLYLTIIYDVEVCDAECDEYVVVLEEYTCSNTSIYMIKPQKRSDIHWDDVEYRCNATEDAEKEKCFVEFNCLGTELHCQDHIKVVNKQTHYFIADNQTAKPSTIRTEAPDVTTSKITVTAKPQLTLDEEFNASMYDINLIFMNEYEIHNRSQTSTKSPQNETLYCDHAETVCFGEIDPENNDFTLIDTYTHHKEPTRTLLISIDRDETSPVQPIFTGYFSESSSDSSKNYNGNFKYLKTMSTPCSIPKPNNCKQKMEINIYLKANYIENNTITKYPNCTKESITSENVLNVKCEDMLFAKNNRHIVQTPLAPTPKQNMWTCQIKEFKNKILSSKNQLRENYKLHFINCSNETNISDSQFKSKDGITPLLDRKNITIHNILTKNGTEINKTETSTGKEKINKDNLSHRNPTNMVTILVIENTNNCSHNISFNIDEGKIIDLDNNENILQNNHVELILTNCINDNSSIINNKEPPPNTELTIILKSESLNASNLEKINGIPTDESVKQRILLRCSHLKNESSSNATSNKTTLECESIDLDFYNITGIELSKNVSETSNTNKEQIKEKLGMVETIGNHVEGIHKNIKLSSNKTVENNGTVNSKIIEDNTKIPFKNNEVQKNISEAKVSKKRYKNTVVQNLAVTFNRRKDIPNSAMPNSFSLGSPERENIFLIGLLSIVGIAILMAIVWRVWPKKREYNVAPTREPADEEETAF